MKTNSEDYSEKIGIVPGFNQISEERAVEIPSTVDRCSVIPSGTQSYSFREKQSNVFLWDINASDSGITLVWSFVSESPALMESSTVYGLAFRPWIQHKSCLAARLLRPGNRDLKEPYSLLSSGFK